MDKGLRQQKPQNWCFNNHCCPFYFLALIWGQVAENRAPSPHPAYQGNSEMSKRYNLSSVPWIPATRELFSYFSDLARSNGRVISLVQDSACSTQELPVGLRRSSNHSFHCPSISSGEFSSASPALYTVWVEHRFPTELYTYFRETIM